MTGFFLSSPLTLLLVPVAVLALGWFGSNRWGWAALGVFSALGLGLTGLWLVAALAVIGVLVTPGVRTRVVSGPLMNLMSKLGFLPKVSKTEKEALEAGTTWADAELFSGKPDFDRLRAEAYPGLSDEEQAFLDGPVEEVCRMTDDWQVWQDRDLPAEVWDYLKKERFFGLIVPREYGGHGFSASANSAVVSKLASRSGTLAITVMVPNSLGPAELLAHYGTQEQKDRYLPRLADGREIPAFALTEPGAGSDAGSITASGEVFRGDDGELYLRLNWRKRYITLAAVSTLLGLAFKLRDPQNLLGKGEELGITCALVPTGTEGVVLGMRHDPMGVPFYNCPTEGHDVVLPLDCIIGGEGGVGRGWLMLMECLAAGRGISLPASATSGVKSSARLAGAYAAIRQQFGLSIGKFEGIHEPLARLGGFAYLSAITVMVPNSLGPAELLAHYGTQEQKDRYLPRLADGREIPAFALTEPGAGSDAGSITASGEVFRGDDGELYLRLNWRKRYITLAAVSTLLGLAFKLRDPQNLLGKGEELGITCALVPTGTEGVVLGMRHDPMGVPFYNCPTEGHDVVLPLDCIIGGEGGVGRGWLMLMECLAAGRGISLPASATSGVKSSARLAGAYAAIRQQFGLSIGKFEGIHEPLARLGGFAYLSEAARRYTCGALDGGAKPAVITAMMKYNTTELSRRAMNDAMDILGGAAISRGPRNLLAHGYIAQPISITVEGANILTRTLVVFGQGAIRCHPFAWSEVQAAERGDAKAFDAALWGHIGHVMRNAARTVLLDLTGGKLGRSPVAGPLAPYYKRLDWASARFAFLADVSMGLLGGDLKRREAVTGRFADVFSWMYLVQATLRRFEAEGQRAEDLPFLRWAADHGFARIQEGFDGLFANLDLPLVGWAFSGPARFWSRVVPMGAEPTDRVGAQVARALQVPGEQRDRMTQGLFIPDAADEALGRIEHTFALVTRAEEVAAKIKAAIKARQLPRQKPLTLLEDALTAGIITAEDHALVLEAEAARKDAVEVDSFTLEQYLETARSPMAEALNRAS